MSTQNHKVSIHFDILADILDANLSITTSRLLIALIAWQDFNIGWSSFDIYVNNPEKAATYAPCIALRRLVGPKSANKSTSIVEMIEAISGSWMFDWLDLSADHKFLYWQFSSHAHERMAMRYSEQRYALLDLDEVASCRTHDALRFYCETMHLRKHPLPHFEMPLNKRWSECRRDLMRSMQSVAEIVGTTYFIGLQWTYRADKKQQLYVRLRHEGTTWFPNKIRDWGSSETRVFKVSADTIREIEPQDFTEYAIPGEAPAMVEANLQRNLRRKVQSDA